MRTIAGRVDLRAVAAAAAVAALTSCSGGGGSAPPVRTTKPQANLAAVTVQITWPPAASKSSARQREYVSPSTTSLSVTVNGGTPVVFSNPNLSGSPLTTTQTIDAPAGSDQFLVQTFDSANVLLGRTTVTETVTLDQANVLPVTLDGELKKIAVVAVPSQPLLEGSLTAGYTLVGAQPELFDIVPEDNDGNVIVAPGAIPALTLTAASSALTVASTSTPNRYAISAAAPTAFVNLTAAGTDLNGTSVTATFKADAIAAIYIANDYTTTSKQQVLVFDENGNAISLASTAFAGLGISAGITFKPATATTPPMLYIADETNPTSSGGTSEGTIKAYDLAGNLLITGSTVGGVGPDGPEYIRYFPALGSGTVFVPDATSSGYTEYDSALNFIASFGGSGDAQFGSVIKSAGAFYDATPSTGSPVFFVTDTSGNTTNSLQEYSADGKTLIGEASAGLAAYGITYDPDDKLLLLTTKVTGAAALVDPYSVVEYSDTLVNKTPQTAFLNNGLKSVEDLMYDPYNKQIYVNDSYQSKTFVFTVAGAAVTTTGTFPGTNHPVGITLVP